MYNKKILTKFKKVITMSKNNYLKTIIFLTIALSSVHKSITKKFLWSGFVASQKKINDLCFRISSRRLRTMKNDVKNHKQLTKREIFDALLNQIRAKLLVDSKGWK